MRLALAMLLVTGCGSTPLPFHCTTDSECTLSARPGICVDTICALTDGTCPSGYRYDESSGMTTCYVFPDDGGLPPDFASAPSDMGTEDLASDAPDMTGPAPDLSGVDLAQAPFAWYVESSGIAQSIRSVWVADASHVYAVADAVGVLFSAGDGKWTTQTTGLPASPVLSDIWGSGLNDIYATGASGSSAGLYHSTGNGTWSAVSDDVSGGQYGIGGTSSTKVFVGGNAGNIGHLNGTTWLAELCGSSSAINSIWAGGSVAYSAGNGGNLCYTTGGGAWAEQTSNTNAQYFTGIFGTSVTDLHAVGYALNFSTGMTTYYVAHSAGTGSWAGVSIPATAKPSVFSRPIWGTSSSDVYIAGQAGHLFHNDGSGWTESVVVDSLGVHATQNLNSISGTGQRNIYIVGGGGLILHGK